MAMTPTSLKEISARVVKTCSIPFGPEDLPTTVIDYLSSANCCVNPECKGESEKKFCRETFNSQSFEWENEASYPRVKLKLFVSWVKLSMLSMPSPK